MRALNEIVTESDLLAAVDGWQEYYYDCGILVDASDAEPPIVASMDATALETRGAGIDTDRVGPDAEAHPAGPWWPTGFAAKPVSLTDRIEARKLAEAIKRRAERRRLDAISEIKGSPLSGARLKRWEYIKRKYYGDVAYRPPGLYLAAPYAFEVQEGEMFYVDANPGVEGGALPVPPRVPIKCLRREWRRFSDGTQSEAVIFEYGGTEYRVEVELVFPLYRPPLPEPLA